MSTIEDFENAPVGATAEDGKWVKFRPTNDYCSEWVEVLAPSNPKTEGASRSNRDMFCDVYTLDPSPVTPTTAQEALDLAWELAHPLKEGQGIPTGTRYVSRSGGGDLATFTAGMGWTPTPSNVKNVRTLDPLPEPEPDWLNAPAVMASLESWSPCAGRQVFTRHDYYDAPSIWRYNGAESYHWSDLTDVTPLYPKQDA